MTYRATRGVSRDRAPLPRAGHGLTLRWVDAGALLGPESPWSSATHHPSIFLQRL